MYILLALLLLAILITVHEFGHFVAARLMKIEVREFAIGMGPKIIGWKSKKYETDFSIRAVPLGGFCAFYGEDDTKGESQDDPRAFPKQNVWKLSRDWQQMIPMIPEKMKRILIISCQLKSLMKVLRKFMMMFSLS